MTLPPQNVAIVMDRPPVYIGGTISFSPIVLCFLLDHPGPSCLSLSSQVHGAGALCRGLYCLLCGRHYGSLGGSPPDSPLCQRFVLVV